MVADFLPDMQTNQTSMQLLGVALQEVTTATDTSRSEQMCKVISHTPQAHQVCSAHECFEDTQRYVYLLSKFHSLLLGFPMFH